MKLLTEKGEMEMEFVLEDAVERPSVVHHAGGRTSVYPFGTMQVGQSFKVHFKSDDKKEREKVIRRVRTAIGSFKKNHPEAEFQTWTANAEDEKDKTEGLRVKRIESMEAVVATTSATTLDSESVEKLVTTTSGFPFKESRL